MHWKEYTHVLYGTSKSANPRSQLDMMPSRRRREHVQYVTPLKIYFRPRLTAVASQILKSLLKTNNTIICSDIVEFYPSISQDLLNIALVFVSAYDTITSNKRNIIIHAKNSILRHKQCIHGKRRATQHLTSLWVAMMVQRHASL